MESAQNSFLDFDLKNIDSALFGENFGPIARDGNLFASSNTLTYIPRSSGTRCGCSGAYTPFELPYAGIPSFLIRNRVFELSVHRWRVTSQEMGELPVTRLFQLIGSGTGSVLDSVMEIEATPTRNVSLATMLELQLKTQNSCELSELSTAIAASLVTCVQDIARNTKHTAA